MACRSVAMRYTSRTTVDISRYESQESEQRDGLEQRSSWGRAPGKRLTRASMENGL